MRLEAIGAVTWHEEQADSQAEALPSTEAATGLRQVPLGMMPVVVNIPVLGHAAVQLRVPPSSTYTSLPKPSVL